MKVNIAKVKEQAQEARSAIAAEERRRNLSREIEWYDLQPGTQVLRLLPPGPDENACYIPGGLVAMSVYTHRLSSTNKVRCVELTYPDMGVKCPIHDLQRDLRQWAREKHVPEEEQKRLTRALNATGRAYTNCIDRNDTGRVPFLLDGKEIMIPQVQVVGLPVTVLKRLNAAIESGAVDDFTDELTGNDIFITRQGSGLTTKYITTLKTRSTPLDEDPDVREAILRSMWNIGQIFRYPTGEAWNEIVAAAQDLRARLTQS